jgi:hypothetical protein
MLSAILEAFYGLICSFLLSGIPKKLVNTFLSVILAMCRTLVLQCVHDLCHQTQETFSQQRPC